MIFRFKNDSKFKFEKYQVFFCDSVKSTNNNYNKRCTNFNRILQFVSEIIRIERASNNVNGYYKNFFEN